MPFPLDCSSSRRNCYTTILFLLHPVHLLGTFMCFSKFMNTSCVEKNTFGSCGFTCIDMCHNPYITCLFQGELSSHVFFSFLSKPNFILPAVMCKCFICFRHFMQLFAFSNSCTCII